ncbi:hypothetical protein ACA910_014108 [Epithemia clementina (nom. ined.)]
MTASGSSTTNQKKSNQSTTAVAPPAPSSQTMSSSSSSSSSSLSESMRPTHWPYKNTAPHRALPLLSLIASFPIVLLHAMLLNFVAVPLGLERAIAAGTVGGFFGLALVPMVTVQLILYCLDHYYFVWTDYSSYAQWAGRPAEATVQSDFYQFVALPFALFYVIQILILDQSHVQVRHAAPIPPKNRLEYWADSLIRSYTDYFPITVLPWSETATLPTTHQYVLAVHPHGIHCLALAEFSTYGSAFDQRFPGLVGHCLTGLAATVMFKIPMVRELFLRMGYVDASRSVAQKVLECGRSIFVCTGGEEESMLTWVGRDIVVLKKRKGFVRLALSHGASLVPVFAVGLNDIFPTYTFLLKQRQWLQKNFGIALPLFHGRYWVTPLPYAKPITVLIGEPIATPLPKIQGERPDEQLVEEYHQKYIAALQALHAKHVHDRFLEIR